jgi:FkbM family methyltransferase
MKWLWKMKALIYDPTVRRIGPMHSLVRLLIFRLSDIFLSFGSKLTGIEVPRTEVPSYFLFPYVFGTHGREVIAWYRQYLQPGMWVVDIGAHVGYHTIRFAKLVGRNGKVIAFEPCGPSFEILKQNVQRARLSNVVLERKAVGDQNGCITLYISPSRAGNTLISGKYHEYCQVEITTLDDYFNDNVTLDLVKIDVEGTEPAVLRGMQSLLARRKVKALILEFYPTLLRDWGTPETPLELLKNLLNDFNVYHIEPKGKLRQIASHEVKDFVISVPKWTNLCAIIRK